MAARTKKKAPKKKVAAKKKTPVKKKVVTKKKAVKKKQVSKRASISKKKLPLKKAARKKKKVSKKDKSSEFIYIDAKFPKKFRSLFERIAIGKKGDPVKNHRYKIYYGGRGAAKSWAFARALLIMGSLTKLRILCAREVQNSIKDSVHQLLKRQIALLELDGQYIVTDKGITGINGTEFIFKGVRRNVDNFKSTEGIDICWVSEAADITKECWDIIRPTIRELNSEIWIDFNTKSDDDDTYRQFVTDAPDNSICILVNYPDNPFFPDVLREEMEEDERRDPDKHKHVWMGEPDSVGARVYPGFDKDVHVRDINMANIAPLGNFFNGQDPHSAYYPACVWIARIEKGSGDYAYILYNEWPTKNMFEGKFYYEKRKTKKCHISLKDRAKQFRIFDNTIDRTYQNIVITARGIDTRFAKASGAASSTLNTKGMILEMADKKNGGLKFETPPEYMIDVQRENLRSYLEFDDLVEISSINEPSFFVLPHCYNCIDSLSFHRFIKSSEGEDEKRKDFCDAIKITLAIAQQNAHIDRAKKYKPAEAPERSRVDDLVQLYTGRGR